MITHRVSLLLERAIDTPLKLHCVMLFTQRVLSRATIDHIGQRLSRDHWSLQEALDHLVITGILQTSVIKGMTYYECTTNPEMLESLKLLTTAYEDPLVRVDMYDQLRDLALYAPYRADFARVTGYAV